MNPSPRLPSNRRRAWLPCFLAPTTVSGEGASATVSGCGLSEAATALLMLMQESTASAIELERLLLCPNTPEHAHWLDEAIRESPETRKKTCWAKNRRRHEAVFREAGLQYPPQPSEAELELKTRMRMSDREAEIVYFFNRVAPMELGHMEEMFIDLSQSIHRCLSSLSNTVPCITPRSRLWKCRVREWLTAPEAMLAQGLDPKYVPALKQFKHRQILDLMGNAFNSSSYLVALATALSFADLSKPRPPCAACDGVHTGCDGVQQREAEFNLEAEMDALDWPDQPEESD